MQFSFQPNAFYDLKKRTTPGPNPGVVVAAFYITNPSVSTNS